MARAMRPTAAGAAAIPPKPLMGISDIRIASSASLFKLVTTSYPNMVVSAPFLFWGKIAAFKPFPHCPL